MNAKSNSDEVAKAAPTLRSLSPTYEEKQHGDYVEILKAELAKDGPDAPRNIALTGHYGSGKSSVLKETQRVIEKTVKVINLSLPSLGVGDGRMPADGNSALDTTNLIQKEIVKQLLYRRRPSEMPASRYSRLDTFHFWPALVVATGFGIAATGIALLAKVPSSVREALPPEAWTWINQKLWWELAKPLQWSSLAVVFVLAVVASLWVQRLLQQRIRVTELTAGPTKVTLSDVSSSYFDEYLDEIVYFFQTSKTSVVIFEDLDRFKDPHIFETLRELNMLLNNAEQTGRTPIRFVYAIRDSIFEQLDLDTGYKTVDEPPSTASPTNNVHEHRHLASTNRTKFFDLVVPMVPFISHRTSRGLILRELEGIAADQRPRNDVVDIVGTHLTDMRLVKNICNEYEVFRRRILSAEGLEALTPDRLFASIVYKNVYLADYEKIRAGTSPLDELYSAYREWARQHTATAREAERLARARLRKIDAIGLRSADLGERLQAVLGARVTGPLHASNFQAAVAGVTYRWDDLTSANFWRAYLEDRGVLTAYSRPGYGGEELAFEKIETLMGFPLVEDDWAEEERTRVVRDIETAEAEHRTAQYATMTDALLAENKLFSFNGSEQSIADVARDLFAESKLVMDLLNSGLIDENFTLYVTQFPGQAISASAMNFIIKAVQRDVMDIEYHFGVGEEVETSDISAVLKAESGRLLGGRSVYNIELFDYLFETDPSKLGQPIRRLASIAPTDTTFIDAYITSGRYAEGLIAQLSGSWAGIFAYIIGAEAVEINERILAAALRGVDPECAYELTNRQRQSLTKAIQRSSVLKEPLAEDAAIALAAVFRNMKLSVRDLSSVRNPLRSELVRLHRYPVTLSNLRAILGGDTELSLDRIKRSHEATVYRKVLAHLGNYLDALRGVNSIPTIADGDKFADVLTDVARFDMDAMREVARRASGECMLSNVGEVDATLWPSLAAEHRFVLSPRNLAAYIAEHGVDRHLADWLKVSRITGVANDSTPLVPLAVDLLNAEALGDRAKLRIVDRLRLGAAAINCRNLTKDAYSTLPGLVERGVVADDSDAYISLAEAGWPLKEQLILASKEFPSYMESLSLTSDDLFNIASSEALGSIKDALLEQLSTFEANLDSKGAVALAKHAASGSGFVATPETIVTLARIGGHRAVQPIFKLLGERAQMIDLDALKQALNALGRPYSQLTVPGHDRPKVYAHEGVVGVLERLVEANIVSKFSLNQKSRVFDVSKRHS